MDSNKVTEYNIDNAIEKTQKDYTETKNYEK